MLKLKTSKYETFCWTEYIYIKKYIYFPKLKDKGFFIIQINMAAMDVSFPMNECSVCIHSYNETKYAKITCPFCDYSCC